VSAQESLGRLTASFKLFRTSSGRDKRVKFLREMQQEVEAVRATFLNANFLLWGAFSYSLSALLQASANGPGFLTPPPTASFAALWICYGRCLFPDRAGGPYSRIALERRRRGPHQRYGRR